MSENIVSIKDLNVNLMTTRGIVHAVQGVDMDVVGGEVHGVVGESGCGKSVTIKSIMKLHEPDKTEYTGQIFFGQDDLLKASRRKVRQLRGKEIAMIFQDPMVSLNPIMKAGEQIAELVREKLKKSKSEAKEHVMDLFELVGILPAEKRYNQYPFEMSGGMLQRVMIAMAISCDPKLLIADEPTTALDVTIQAQILQLLKDLQSKMHMSVIFVTHNLGVVAEICNSVSVMYAGKVVEHGKVKDIFDSPQHPYTIALLDSNPKESQKSKYMKTIPGSPPPLFEKFKGCAFVSRCDKAMEICKTQDPVMTGVGQGHEAACHLCRPLEVQI